MARSTSASLSPPSGPHNTVTEATLVPSPEIKVSPPGCNTSLIRLVSVLTHHGYDPAYTQFDGLLHGVIHMLAARDTLYQGQLQRGRMRIIHESFRPDQDLTPIDTGNFGLETSTMAVEQVYLLPCAQLQHNAKMMGGIIVKSDDFAYGQDRFRVHSGLSHFCLDRINRVTKGFTRLGLG
jgi:hypothetical protein